MTSGHVAIATMYTIGALAWDDHLSYRALVCTSIQFILREGAVRTKMVKVGGHFEKEHSLSIFGATLVAFFRFLFNFTIFFLYCYFSPI